jgi:hypothetical protein
MKELLVRAGVARQGTLANVDSNSRKRKASEGMSRRSLSTEILESKNYVPWAQEDRYLSCSLDKLSMRMPIDESFSLATQFSTSLGTS